jgi:hypothetical protein
MFTPLAILLMIANTIAASGVALMALQVSLSATAKPKNIPRSFSNSKDAAPLLYFHWHFLIFSVPPSAARAPLGARR